MFRIYRKEFYSRALLRYMVETGPVKTVQTSMEIVNLLTQNEGQNLSEIAETLDMPTSTTHDHLQMLVELDFVNREGNVYSLSTKFLEIGGRKRKKMELFRVARPEIFKLAKQTDEHASLLIEENFSGVLIFHSKGENAVELGAYPGLRIPLVATAQGKAILSQFPENRLEAFVESYDFPEFTEQTITRPEDLYEELDALSQQGYAMDAEEYVEGVRNIAVPIVAHNDVKGAIGIGGPLRRMEDRQVEKEYKEMLLETANVIELSLTY